MKRVLKIPLLRIPGSLFCPAQALLLSKIIDLRKNEKKATKQAAQKVMSEL
jgi:hypothetical protein